MRSIARLVVLNLATLVCLAGTAPAAAGTGIISPADLQSRAQVPSEVDAEGRDITGRKRNRWKDPKAGKNASPPKTRKVQQSNAPAESDCVEQVLRGVTETEMQTGALLISGNRSVACLDPSFALAFSPQLAVNEMLVALRLPDVTPQFGPSPSVNEWGMLPVGHPIWLWTAGPRTRSASVASQGVTFRLSATWVSTRFTMGDGATVTCTSMSKYTEAVVPGAPSRSCGHVYSTPSLPKGDYTVTATATWRINWSVAGTNGSFRHAYSDTAQLPIGELQALIVR